MSYNAYKKTQIQGCSNFELIGKCLDKASEYMQKVIDGTKNKRYEEVAIFAEKIFEILGALRANIILEDGLPENDPAKVLDMYYHDNMILLRRVTQNNDIELGEQLKSSFKEMANTWRIVEVAHRGVGTEGPAEHL